MKEVDSFYIEDGKIKDLKRVYELMEEDFPVDELKSFSWMKKLMEDGKYSLILLKANRENIIAAYAFLLPLETGEVWLDYIAVRPELRGQGMGKDFIQRIKSRYPNRGGMYIEVERADANEADEREIQRRRRCFYEDLGAGLMDIEYRLPTERGSMILDLYYMPFRGEKKVNAQRVFPSIEEVFKVVHGDYRHADKVLRCIKEESLK